jgi:hypothetical protein
MLVANVTSETCRVTARKLWPIAVTLGANIDVMDLRLLMHYSHTPMPLN